MCEDYLSTWLTAWKEKNERFLRLSDVKDSKESNSENINNNMNIETEANL